MSMYQELLENLEIKSFWSFLIFMMQSFFHIHGW